MFPSTNILLTMNKKPKQEVKMLCFELNFKIQRTGGEMPDTVSVELFSNPFQ